MLTPETLPTVQRALADAGLDGWLLFDFRGANPVAAGMLGLRGMLTRRIFAWVPRSGVPHAVTHPIEQGPWRDWPTKWEREQYGSWRALEDALGRLVKGKRIAMEYSPGDAVPYVDRIPAGILDMVRAAGAEVVSSGELVSRFYATWSAAHMEGHRRAAEIVARVAQEALRMVGARIAAGEQPAEHEVQAWIADQFRGRGLEFDDPPIVAAGANAANPHYSPSKTRERRIRKGELLLIDLWAREKDAPYADQTWMGSIGTPDERQRTVWLAVRDARDAAIALLRDRAAKGLPVRGAEVDDAARKVITERGFGEYFAHRTGHSIDPHDLHGSGPHIDNLESREERVLIPGVGFSIEPGVYIPGEIGVRSEVDAYMGDGEVVVTPGEYQRDLIVV